MPFPAESVAEAKECLGRFFVLAKDCDLTHNAWNMLLMRIQRMAMCGFALALGSFVLGVAAQNVNPNSELKTSTSAKVAKQPDRRYAIAPGAWSAATIALFNTWSALDDNRGRRISFYSPDHQKVVEVRHQSVIIRVGRRTFNTDINNQTKHDAELGWSPDSARFFVTWSESGELGPWHLQVYGVDGSGIHEFPKVEEPAREDFERRVRHWPIDPALDTPELRTVWNSDEYCEPYHVIGGRWLNGSEEILLSILIRNTGDCRYMSEFNAYRVNATTGKILQRFTAVQSHKRFGDKYLPLITR